MSVVAKAVVVDASVALKWVFNDEEGIEQASQLLADSIGGGLYCTRLTFWVMNGATGYGQRCANSVFFGRKR